MNVPLPNAGILSPLVFCHVGFAQKQQTLAVSPI